jgi:hypothetical protein
VGYWRESCTAGGFIQGDGVDACEVNEFCRLQEWYGIGWDGMGWDGCYGWMRKDVPTIVLSVVNAFNARDIVNAGRSRCGRVRGRLRGRRESRFLWRRRTVGQVKVKVNRAGPAKV